MARPVKPLRAARQRRQIHPIPPTSMAVRAGRVDQAPVVPTIPARAHIPGPAAMGALARRAAAPALARSPRYRARLPPPRRRMVARVVLPAMAGPVRQMAAGTAAGKAARPQRRRPQPTPQTPRLRSAPVHPRPVARAATPPAPALRRAWAGLPAGPPPVRQARAAAMLRPQSARRAVRVVTAIMAPPAAQARPQRWPIRSRARQMAARSICSRPPRAAMAAIPMAVRRALRARAVQA